MLFKFSNYMGLLIIVLLTITSGLKAQPFAIKGLVLSNNTKKSIAGANVLVKNNDSIVLFFSTTNLKGEFTIEINDYLQIGKYFLEVLVIGYLKKIVPLSINKNYYTIFLEEDPKELDSVTVKSILPLKKRGDTLSYLVNAFEKNEDRTIGDVIKRIPGMSVSDNGQISFNGKPIANLFIQGDDLMDGRYGLATKSINKNMIKSIEVIQNFQPIKLLQNKVWSDDVVVNLSLKDENSIKVAGIATVGGGLPGLYDTDATVMLFNKKIKFLNSLKLNNRGTDYRNEFKMYTQEMQQQSLNNNRPSKLLSLATISNPDISESLFYNNSSIAANLNNLYNTKDSVQLKTNIQLFKDVNSLSFANINNYFINNDTIVFNQFQQTNNTTTAANFALTINVNKQNKYINNKLSILLEKEENSANLVFNTNAFPQSIKNRVRDFSNDFIWLPLLKNSDILSIKWHLNYLNTNQNLFVNTALDSTVLNNDKSFKTVQQSLLLPSFFSNINASYIIGKKRLITQVYEVGFISENQKNQSSIAITQLNNTINNFTGDVGNNLNWQRNRVFGAANFNIDKKNFKLNAVFPLSYQHIKIEQQAYLLNEVNERFFINPSIKAQLYVGDEDNLELSYSYQNNFSNINSVFRGLMLTNYRTLQNNTNLVQEMYKSGSGVVFNFRRALKMLMITTGIKYSRNTANTINNTTLSNNTLQTELINFDNQQNSIIGNAEISKYFFKIKTKVLAQFFFSRNFSNQFVNNTILNFTNDAFSAAFFVDAKITEQVNFLYTSNFMLNTSNQINTNKNIKNSFQRFDNSAVLNYTPKNYLIQLRANSIYTQQASNSFQQFFFADFLIRRQIKKIDFSIEINNVLNTKQYQLFNVDANVSSFSSIPLRGRLAIAKMTFNF